MGEGGPVEVHDDCDVPLWICVIVKLSVYACYIPTKCVYLLCRDLFTVV